MNHQTSQVPTKQGSQISSLVWPIIAGLIIAFLVVFTFNTSWGIAGLIGLIVFLIGYWFWPHDSQDGQVSKAAHQRTISTGADRPPRKAQHHNEHGGHSGCC